MTAIELYNTKGVKLSFQKCKRAIHACVHMGYRIKSCDDCPAKDDKKVCVPYLKKYVIPYLDEKRSKKQQSKKKKVRNTNA